MNTAPRSFFVAAWIAASMLTLDAAGPTRTLDEIEWHDSLPAAQAEAASSSRPILIYFWLDGSAFCQQMYADTLTTEQGTAELANFVCLSIQADQDQARELVQRYGVKTLPTLVFVDAAGQAEDAIRGKIVLEGFLAEAQRIRRGVNTVSDWRRRAQAAPDDLDVRLRLALQLEHVGQLAECGRLQTSIKEGDPQGLTFAGAQLHLYAAFDSVINSSSDASDAGTYVLGSLYEHMSRVTPEPQVYPVLFEGWKWIADVESQRGERPKERAAWGEVWRFAPAGAQRLNSGFSVVQRYFQMEAELSNNERQLADEIAAHLEAAAKSQPDVINLPFVHNCRAMALAINGEHEQALAEAEKAVELAPDDPMHQRLRDLLQSQAN